MLKDLFKSKLAVKILDTFYARPEEELYVRELARHLGEPVSSVAKQLETLSALGLFRTRERGGVKFHALDQDCPIGAEIESLFAKTVGLVRELKKHLMAAEGVELAYLVGDVDENWPLTEPLRLIVVGWELSALAEVVGAASRRVGRKVNLSTFTPEEYRSLPDSEVAGFHTVLIN